MWLSLRLVADAVLMLNSQTGDYISAGFRGESELWEGGGGGKRGCTYHREQQFRLAGEPGMWGRGVVAASNLKVLGREEMDPPQNFLLDCLEG